MGRQGDFRSATLRTVIMSNLSDLFPKPNALQGLRQQEQCDRIGSQSARQLGLSTHAYLQQKTGWQLQSELYYPPAKETS